MAQEKRRRTAQYIARIGVLGALSAILYWIPGIPVIPPIYKLDFSTLPVLLGGFSLGPWYSLIILAIKDLTGLMHSSSLGVGELADFLMSGAFVVVASLIYQKRRTFKGAVMGMVLGIVAMAITSALTNYYIMLPFYMTVMGMSMDKIVGSVQKMIPAVDSLPKLIALATVPFNLLKGIVLSLITTLIYKRLSPLLRVEGNR